MSDGPDSPSEDTAYNALHYLFSRYLQASMEEKDPVVERLEALEKEVNELKKEREIRTVPSKADTVYLKFKDSLEKEHFGKIVAIDIDSEKVVGIGSSVLEAYEEARKRSSKKQFSFRRIGFDFLHKL
jgi:uncharacterized protein YuzE